MKEKEQIKSGKEVIEDFFAEILNVPKADEETIKILVSLYEQDKFTEKSIQNALGEMLNKELKKIEKENE